jgi:hypothetical protein
LADDDVDDADFVPDFDEEEEFEEEEGEGEATLNAWTDALADHFIVPFVDRDLRVPRDRQGENDHWEMIWGSALPVMSPRARRRSSKDVPRSGMAALSSGRSRQPAYLSRSA